MFTFGFGDAITCVEMIEERGINGEGNFFVRYIILNFGATNFIYIKIFVTSVILITIFLLKDATYSMINGYLTSFIVFGYIGMVLNIQATKNDQAFLSPEQVIFLFVSLVLIFTTVGEEIDKRTILKIRPHYDCFVNDIKVISKTIRNTFKKKE